MWFLTWNDVQYNRMRVPDDCDVSCYLVYNPVRTFVLAVQRYEKTIRTSEVLRKKCGIRGKIDLRHVKSAWNVDFCHDYAAVLFKNNSTFANGEVKEFKEIREVKAKCFTAKFSTQKAVGYNF